MRFFEHLAPRLASLADDKCRSEPRMLSVAREMERTAETLYRGIWEKAALERHRLGETAPEWTYLPLKAWTGIMGGYICPGCGYTRGDHVHRGADRDPFHAEVTLLAAGMTAAWRATRTVYKMDATLAAELIATPLKNMPPAEALLHLPDWCIAADFPEPLALHKGLMFGFLAQPCLLANGDTVIVAMTTMLCDGRVAQEPCLLPLSKGVHDFVSLDGYIADALFHSLNESTRERYRAYAAKNGLRHPGNILLDEVVGLIPPTGLAQCSLDGLPEVVSDLRTIATAVVSSMLYIASPHPDVLASERRPTPKAKSYGTRKSALKTAKGPVKTIVADVGYRVGATLRRGRTNAPAVCSNPGTGSPKSPHKRSGHWHMFLRGPRDAEMAEAAGTTEVAENRRERVYHWIPPIIVNADKTGEDGLRPLVRRVASDEDDRDRTSACSDALSA